MNVAVVAAMSVFCCGCSRDAVHVAVFVVAIFEQAERGWPPALRIAAVRPRHLLRNKALRR